MTAYTYTLYSERVRPYDRYAMDIMRYASGKISAASRNAAIEKAILKVGMHPKGDILEICTEKGTLVTKLMNTERPVEPWGRQWSEGDRMKDTTRNFHIHNGCVYFVKGMGRYAYRLNPQR